VIGKTVQMKQAETFMTEKLSLKTHYVFSLCHQHLHSAATFLFLNWKAMTPISVKVIFMRDATFVYEQYVVLPIV